MYSDADHPMLCIGCSGPRSIDHARTKPGEIAYKPCACGAFGIRRPGDLYQKIHRKKTTVAPYDRSPYRGAKLP